jgi:NTP pyrophosphatase (non-canonical NTP hydrolase)
LVDRKFTLPLQLSDSKEFSLDDWQEFFKIVYGKRNQSIRHNTFNGNLIAYTRGYVIAHLVEDLGNLAESIREGNVENMEKYIASQFAWLFVLCEDFGFDMSTITFKKFPGRCHYCGEYNDCAEAWWTHSILHKNKHRKGYKPGWRKKPETLEGWLDMFDAIYGAKAKVAMQTHDLMHKLYEELAEIMQGLDKATNGKTRTYHRVKYEIPDYVSWLFSLIVKLKQYGFIGGENMATILWKKFKNGCLYCHKENTPPHNRCECPPPKWT